MYNLFKNHNQLLTDEPLPLDLAEMELLDISRKTPYTVIWLAPVGKLEIDASCQVAVNGTLIQTGNFEFDKRIQKTSAEYTYQTMLTRWFENVSGIKTWVNPANLIGGILGNMAEVALKSEDPMTLLSGLKSVLGSPLNLQLARVNGTLYLGYSPEAVRKTNLREGKRQVLPIQWENIGSTYYRVGRDEEKANRSQYKPEDLIKGDTLEVITYFETPYFYQSNPIELRVVIKAPIQFITNLPRDTHWQSSVCKWVNRGYQYDIYEQLPSTMEEPK